MRSLLFAVLCVSVVPDAFAADALDRALSAELTRAKKELKDEGFDGIYYASADVWDFSERAAWSQLGSPVALTGQDQRLVLFDVRVGSPALDNHPLEPKADYLGQAVPMTEDEKGLRHAFWRLLDGAYKTASGDYLRKRALRVQKGKADYDADDLAPEPPHTRRLPPPPPKDPAPALKAAVIAVTEPLRGAAGVVFAGANAQWSRSAKRRRDTAGAAVDSLDEDLILELDVEGIAPDGMRQSVHRELFARRPETLPQAEALAAFGASARDELAALLAAPSTAPFNAPALVDPEVAGALTLALAMRLTGEEIRNPSGAQTFRGRLGERVLPEQLSLVDDPTVAAHAGADLMGSYDYDDQGVPARRASLIEKGALKGLLLSRYAAKGFPRSNGHARAAPGRIPLASPANLFLTTSSPEPEAALLERLRQQCRARGLPYGLWLRGAQNWSQEQGGGGQGSIRVKSAVWLVSAETGALTRVRDLDLVGTPLVMLGGILAAGADARVWSDSPAGFPVSVVAPSLLLADAELQRAQAQPEKPPLLPAP
jgi:TldD protein